MEKQVKTNSFLDSDKIDLLRVRYGRIQWIVDGSHVISCGMFFEKFPFDNQNCEFWVASADAFTNTSLFTSNYAYNPYSMQKELPFHLEISALKREPVFFSRSLTGFHIGLKRKIFPYILNIYFPTVVLVIIALISFLIPVSCVSGRILNIILQI